MPASKASWELSKKTVQNREQSRANSAYGGSKEKERLPSPTAREEGDKGDI